MNIQELIEKREAELQFVTSNRFRGKYKEFAIELLETVTWKPIESAPKDGTRILLRSNGDEYDVGYWSTSLWVKPGGAWIIYEARSDTIEIDPTHWRSLFAIDKALEELRK